MKRTPSRLLVCGIMLAPLFYATVVIQILTRRGFDITQHPLSLLALGDMGWIQVANFLVAAMLALACAIGMRRTLTGTDGGTWGPLLIATYAIGFIIAGLSPADPLPGFPPGAVTAIAPEMSGHAMGHGVGFMIAFVSLIACCFVFARRFARLGNRGWSVYSTGTGLATLALIALGMVIQPAASLSFFVVGIVAFGWLGAVCAKLFHEGPSER